MSSFDDPPYSLFPDTLLIMKFILYIQHVSYSDLIQLTLLFPFSSNLNIFVNVDHVNSDLMICEYIMLICKTCLMF